MTTLYKHSVSRWCYDGIPFPELAAACRRIGIGSIELMLPEEFDSVADEGLICAMTSCNEIERGLNRVENHDKCLGNMEQAIEATAARGWPNVICFSGNREGMSDAEGRANCASALKRIAPLAEEKGVTICMELLNSKRSHPDYMCDHTAWGVELCEAVGSDRFKLLYDIFHMQIMEGDLMNTLKKALPWIGHIHTGGVPGRAEIDETQEIQYRPIMQLLVAEGYDGWVGQEFVPRAADPLASLEAAVKLCSV